MLPQYCLIFNFIIILSYLFYYCSSYFFFYLKKFVLFFTKSIRCYTSAIGCFPLNIFLKTKCIDTPLSAKNI